MLKERTTYEIMNPQDVGWEGTRLVVGKHSGRAGFRNSLNEIGIRLDDEQLQVAYLKFLELADRKKHVTAADLAALVSNQLQLEGDTYHLVQWKVDIGSGEPAVAQVVLIHHDQRLIGEAEGNGPVEAMLKAIDAASAGDPGAGVLPGRSGHAEKPTPRRRRTSASVPGNKIFTGHGLSTDIVEASARAYVAALSRVDRDQPSTVLAGSSTSRWT